MRGSIPRGRISIGSQRYLSLVGNSESLMKLMTEIMIEATTISDRRQTRIDEDIIMKLCRNIEINLVLIMLSSGREFLHFLVYLGSSRVTVSVSTDPVSSLAVMAIVLVSSSDTIKTSHPTLSDTRYVNSASDYLNLH